MDKMRKAAVQGKFVTHKGEDLDKLLRNTEVLEFMVKFRGQNVFFKKQGTDWVTYRVDEEGNVLDQQLSPTV